MREELEGIISPACNSMANSALNAGAPIEDCIAYKSKVADQILTLLKEEIEKSLLTKEEIDIEARARARNTWLEYGKDIAQAQVNNTLKIVEENDGN